MTCSIRKFDWVGSKEHFVDRICVKTIQQVTIGRFGGNSSAGQYKNEDGCLVWIEETGKWEFALILDAHNTAESAELVIEHFKMQREEITELLSSPLQTAFKTLEKTILNLFQSAEFLDACQNVKGETACLILARKDKYIWWFSIGDCISYILHPEFASLGQFQINQRQFFEWVGQVNTFQEPLPCYSSGVKELRTGSNRILLTTDGLIECPNEPFSNPAAIYDAFQNSDDDENVLLLLQRLKEHPIRDSTTIITWIADVSMETTEPSNG